MLCVICKHGTTAEKPVTITLDHRGFTLVVRGVPAEVCDNCGEQYVGSAVAAELLRTAQAGASTGAEVEVRKFVAA